MSPIQWHRWCFEKSPVFQDFQVQNGSRSSGWFGDVDGAIGKGQPQRQGADLPKGQRESWFRHFGEA